MAQARNIERKEAYCSSLVCFRVGEEKELTNGRCSQPSFLRVTGVEDATRRIGGGVIWKVKNVVQSNSQGLSFENPKGMEDCCNTARRHALTLDCFFQLVTCMKDCAHFLGRLQAVSGVFALFFGLSNKVCGQTSFTT
jgi:hypothetical protein